MTARELMKALDKFEGSSIVKIEGLTRDNNGQLVNEIIGEVEVVTGNGRIIFLSTWKGDSHGQF